MDALSATALTVAGTALADRYVLPRAPTGTAHTDPSSPGAGAGDSPAGEQPHWGYVAALAKARETWPTARTLVEAWGFEVRDGRAAHGLAPGHDAAPYWPVEEAIRVERRWRGILTATLLQPTGAPASDPSALMRQIEEVDNVISFHELVAAAGTEQWDAVSLDCYRTCRKAMLLIDSSEAPGPSSDPEYYRDYSDIFFEQLGGTLGGVGSAVGSALGSIGVGIVRGLAGVASSPAGAALLLVGAYVVYRKTLA